MLHLSSLYFLITHTQVLMLLSCYPVGKISKSSLPSNYRVQCHNKSGLKQLSHCKSQLSDMNLYTCACSQLPVKWQPRTAVPPLLGLIRMVCMKHQVVIMRPESHNVYCHLFKRTTSKIALIPAYTEHIEVTVLQSL